MVNNTSKYNLLKEIYFLLDDGDRQLLSQFNLTIPRFYALVHLGTSPGLMPNQLSELMLCDKSNVARLIKGMEADQLVYRRPHESDGRSYRLYLTERGNNLRRKASAAHNAYNDRRFRNGELKESPVWHSLTQLKKQLRAELDN